MCFSSMNPHNFLKFKQKLKNQKLKTFQNELLRITLKTPRFMWNKHNETGLPLLSTWITNQFKNFHDRLNKTEGALYLKTSENFPRITKKTANSKYLPRQPRSCWYQCTRQLIKNILSLWVICNIFIVTLQKYRICWHI